MTRNLLVGVLGTLAAFVVHLASLELFVLLGWIRGAYAHHYAGPFERFYFNNFAWVALAYWLAAVTVLDWFVFGWSRPRVAAQLVSAADEAAPRS